MTTVSLNTPFWRSVLTHDIGEEGYVFFKGMGWCGGIWVHFLTFPKFPCDSRSVNTWVHRSCSHTAIITFFLCLASLILNVFGAEGVSSVMWNRIWHNGPLISAGRSAGYPHGSGVLCESNTCCSFCSHLALGVGSRPKIYPDSKWEN